MHYIPELDLSVLESFYVTGKRTLTKTSQGKGAKSRDSCVLPAGRKLLSRDGDLRSVSGHCIDEFVPAGVLFPCPLRSLHLSSEWYGVPKSMSKPVLLELKAFGRVYFIF